MHRYKHFRLVWVNDVVTLLFFLSSVVNLIFSVSVRINCELFFFAVNYVTSCVRILFCGCAHVLLCSSVTIVLQCRCSCRLFGAITGRETKSTIPVSRLHGSWSDSEYLVSSQLFLWRPNRLAIDRHVQGGSPFEGAAKLQWQHADCVARKPSLDRLPTLTTCHCH